MLARLMQVGEIVSREGRYLSCYRGDDGGIGRLLKSLMRPRETCAHFAATFWIVPINIPFSLKEWQAQSK